MMRVRRDSANHNRPAGKFGKATSPDLDGGRAADAAFVCLRIIADSQCNLSNWVNSACSNVTRVAAATCTAAGCCCQRLRIVSNAQQPQLQSRKGSLGKPGIQSSR
jgi:hypothetical protein